MKKILILFGGNSHEHQISCLSAKTIIENIDKNNNWFIFNNNKIIIKKNIKARELEYSILEDKK